MSKITYNAELLKLMTLFEKTTRTRVKDCFYDESNLLTFVVNQVDIGKAIGKNASNVKKLESLLKRKIKIVAFNPSVELFVKNLIYPVEAEVELQESVIIIKPKDNSSKGFLIGRNRSNIANMLSIVKKYFKDTKDMKVM